MNEFPRSEPSRRIFRLLSGWLLALPLLLATVPVLAACPTGGCVADSVTNAAGTFPDKVHALILRLAFDGDALTAEAVAVTGELAKTWALVPGSRKHLKMTVFADVGLAGKPKRLQQAARVRALKATLLSSMKAQKVPRKSWSVFQG
jgi:hypothetical protein